MTAQELGTTWSSLGLVILSSATMLVGIIVYVRLAGLRSFSKMSAFDFAVTIAFGSILGTVALSKSSLAEGLVAAASLLALQTLIGIGRAHLGLGRVVDNAPLLLVADGVVVDDHLRSARITRSDIDATLRSANVASLDDVTAVVLETTGDLTVVHGHQNVDRALFENVRGAELLGDGSRST